MKKLSKILLLAIIVLGVLIVSYSKSTTSECSMSLCDCKCHPKSQTPEELTGRLCGINCFQWYNVTGCKLVNNVCLTTPIKCEEYCLAMPHVMCIGYWIINGNYPNCNCQKICSSACVTDADCPQPKCVGMKAVCDNGVCKIVNLEKKTTKCG